ncbi:MAG: LEA type 2 family protein [Psychroserpens sp.]|uniref:LEA type 2 family protein n=1 Tax=Psychroserpens sp. TaxID=2020870 RepID=UPI003C733BAB
MRRFILLSTLIVLFCSCSINEKPLFIAVSDIEMVDADAKTVSFIAKARFENPNDVGGSLKSDAILVFVNDIKVARVSSENFKVPAKKEFTIPLKVVVSTDSILKRNGGDAIQNLLNSLLSKTVKVQYKGDLVYKTFGFSHLYNIDETQLVNIKF